MATTRFRNLEPFAGTRLCPCSVGVSPAILGISMAGGSPALQFQKHSSLDGREIYLGCFPILSWFWFLAVIPLWLIHLASLAVGFLAVFSYSLVLRFFIPSRSHRRWPWASGSAGQGWNLKSLCQASSRRIDCFDMLA